MSLDRSLTLTDQGLVAVTLPRHVPKIKPGPYCRICGQQESHWAGCPQTPWESPFSDITEEQARDVLATVRETPRDAA